MSLLSRAAAVATVAAALAVPATASAELPRSAAALFPYPGDEITLVNHRGLSPGFPENTLAAFRNSVAMGVDAIEIDLRTTKDGKIVILHDTTVDRTTNGVGNIVDLTLAEAKTLDAGDGERIPTFEETLEAVKGSGVKLLLDIKTSSVTEESVRLTKEAGMIDQVIVGPRTVDNLKAYKALDPSLKTLGFIATAADAQAMVDAGVDYIRLWPHWILPSRDDAACQADYAARVVAFERGERDHPGSASCVVEQVNQMGVPVWSTVNDLAAPGMDELIQLGATGILSDLPGELDRLLEDIDGKRLASATAQVTALTTALRREHGLWRVLSQVVRTPHRAGALFRDAARATDAQGRLAKAASQLRRGDVSGACGGLQTIASRIESLEDHGWETREVRRTLACAERGSA